VQFVAALSKFRIPMPVYESEAIVLRQYSLSDSDRIIVFITREYGKIRAAAQGVKKMKSRMAGSLELLNHIHLEFWTREGSELAQIRRAELIHSCLGKQPDLTRICAFSYFAEITNEVAQENQPNQALFRLLLASLNVGEGYGVSESLIRYFEIWCLKLNGLLPNYAYCSNCGKCVKDDGFFAWLEAGQARCFACAQGRGIRVGAAAAAILESMMRQSPERFAVQPLENEAAIDVERLSQRLMSLYLEKQLKSYRILKEALQNRIDTDATKKYSADHTHS
jgi:DNA repair protein RecO (recombination protein O)